METKRAYGIVTALGTKLGERARTEPAILDEIRGAPTLEAFHALMRMRAQGLVPEAVLAAFLDEVLTPADWIQWRARVLLQAKLVRDGGKPAPGHEKGRGVGRP